jgi:hypothetical protein
MTLAVESAAIPESGVVPRRPGLTAWEFVLVAVVLLALFAAQFALSNSFSLFTRQYWYDESVTQSIAGDPDLSHSMKALAAGVDSQPPTPYLLLRGFVTVFGGANELTLRSFAFLAVFIGLLGVYASLRLYFPPLPSFAATLALAAHPLLLFHAVEARPYNLLFATVAWFIYFLLRCRMGDLRWPGILGLVLTAMLVATSHYFGIICLGLIVAGDTVVSFRSTRVRWLHLLALGAGGLALLACFPFLRSQRAAFSVATWLVRPDRAEILRVLGVLFLPPFFLVFVAWVIILGLVHYFRRRRSTQSLAPQFKPFFGVIGLVLLPFVLLLMSYVLQPVYLERYALPSLTVLAIPVAYVSARQPPWAIGLLCAGFCICGGLELNRLAVHYRGIEAGRKEFQAFLREHCPEDQPIVFQFPLRLFVIERYAPDLAAHCYQLDFDSRDVDSTDDWFFLRDQAHVNAAYFAHPKLITVAELRTRPVAFLVVEKPDLIPRFRCFADSKPQHLGQGVFELRMSPDP